MPSDEEKDEKKPESAAAQADKLVDEAFNAAAETRKAAQWIATALGGVPALAIVTALVKGPGEGGFEEGLLLLGLLVGAAGAIGGIYALAKVMEPVEATDQQVVDAGFDVQRVPGHPFPSSYEDLGRRLRELRRQHTIDVVAASDAEVHAKQVSATASVKEAVLKAREQQLGEPKNNEEKAELARLKAARDEAHALAAAAASKAVAIGVALELTKKRLDAAETVRGRCLQLFSADVVRHWYKDALNALGGAVIAVVIGVFLLAISSQPKDEPVVATPTLVSLSLNDAGQEALGCSLSTVKGLRVGEEDGIPLVVTLPTDDCEAAVLRFNEEAPSLGSMTEVSPEPAAAG